MNWELLVLGRKVVFGYAIVLLFFEVLISVQQYWSFALCDRGKLICFRHRRISLSLPIRLSPTYSYNELAGDISYDLAFCR